MKKITISLFTILIGLISFCQEFIEFTPSESTNPTHVIQASEDTIVEFEILIPGVFATEMDSFQRIEIEDHSRMNSVGFPELPVLSFLVAIPDCDAVNLEIELLDSIKFEDVHIYPAPEMVLDSNAAGVKYYREEFAYNTNAYGINSNYPGMIAQSVNKGAVRAQHCICIFVYPVQYNPVTNEIIAYSNIQLSLTFNNPSGSINNDVGIFNEMLGNSMINYISNGLNASVSCGAGIENAGNWYYVDDVSSQKIDSACDYVIITHDSLYFKDAGQAAIDSLAAHRANFNGFDVAIITTTVIDEDITPIGLDLKEKIFKLIENTYNSNNANHTYDGKLAYVNLFADVDLEIGLQGIPTHEEGYDVYFTQLTYDTVNGQVVYDDYPDLMIGRCSVDDTTQVKNVVHKILNYKPDALDWKYDMLTIATSGDFYGIQSNVLMAMDEIIP